MKSRSKKIGGWIVGILGGLVLVVVVGIHLVPMHKNDKKVKEIALPAGVDGRLEHFDIYGRDVRALVLDDCQRSDSVLVVLCHGAPGSLDVWEKVFASQQLLRKAKVVSYDRPGYGEAKRGGAMYSIDEQAKVLHELIERYADKTIVLVGHSYGGPIVAKVAANYPHLVDGIMMLAPVIDPDNEKEFWFAKITQWKLLRWMIPRALKVAGDEKMNHADELAKMKDDWRNIACPVVHIHGDADFLAPPSNISFSKENIASEYLKMIEIPEGNHFIPFSRVELVEKELLELIGRLYK